MWGGFVALVLGAAIAPGPRKSDITLAVLVAGMLVIGLYGVVWYSRWKRKQSVVKKNLGLLVSFLEGSTIAPELMSGRKKLASKKSLMSASLRVDHNGKWLLENY